MFCQIVSLPRSGSHMLGTALHSHPDLNCKGERSGKKLDVYSDEGNVEIAHIVGSEPCAEKYIALVRDADARELSWMRTTSRHFMEEVVIHGETARETRRLKNLDKNQKKLTQWINDNDCLVLNYDDLTQGKDIREIPETIGKQICDFLGVDYHPLIPVTYKPEVRL